MFDSTVDVVAETTTPRLREQNKGDASAKSNMNGQDRRFPKGTPEFYRIMSTNSGSDATYAHTHSQVRRSKSKDTPRAADGGGESPLEKIRSWSESPAQQGTSDSEGGAEQLDMSQYRESEIYVDTSASAATAGRASTGDLHTRRIGEKPGTGSKMQVKKRKSNTNTRNGKKKSAEDLAFQYDDDFDWTCYGEIV